MHSKQTADPRSKRGYRREYDKKLQQLAFDVKSVFPVFVHVLRLRVVILEEAKSAKKEPVKENHVVSFVDGKDKYKSCEECGEREPGRRKRGAAVRGEIFIRGFQKEKRISAVFADVR